MQRRTVMKKIILAMLLLTLFAANSIAQGLQPQNCYNLVLKDATKSFAARSHFTGFVYYDGFLELDGGKTQYPLVDIFLFTPGPTVQKIFAQEYDPQMLVCPEGKSSSCGLK